MTPERRDAVLVWNGLVAEPPRPGGKKLHDETRGQIAGETMKPSPRELKRCLTTSVCNSGGGRRSLDHGIGEPGERTGWLNGLAPAGINGPLPPDARVGR